MLRAGRARIVLITHRVQPPGDTAPRPASLHASGTRARISAVFPLLDATLDGKTLTASALAAPTLALPPHGHLSLRFVIRRTPPALLAPAPTAGQQPLLPLPPGSYTLEWRLRLWDVTPTPPDAPNAAIVPVPAVVSTNARNEQRYLGPNPDQPLGVDYRAAFFPPVPTPLLPTAPDEADNG